MANGGVSDANRPQSFTGRSGRACAIQCCVRSYLSTALSQSVSVASHPCICLTCRRG